MSSLYNITEKYLFFLNKLEEKIIETDFEANNLEDIAKEELENLNVTRDEARDKIEAYYYFIQQKEGEINVIDDEIERLKNLKKSKETLINKLKEKVDFALRLFGDKTDKGNFKLDCKNIKVWNVFTKSVKLTENFENDKFGRYDCKLALNKEEVKKLRFIFGNEIQINFIPDKKLIKQTIESGLNVEGAEIDNNAAYVRFK